MLPVNVCIYPIAPDAHAVSRSHICARRPGASDFCRSYSGTIVRLAGDNSPADERKPVPGHLQRLAHPLSRGLFCWCFGGMSTETAACVKHGISLDRLDCRALALEPCPSPVKLLRHRALPPLLFTAVSSLLLCPYCSVGPYPLDPPPRQTTPQSHS